MLYKNSTQKLLNKVFIMLIAMFLLSICTLYFNVQNISVYAATSLEDNVAGESSIENSTESSVTNGSGLLDDIRGQEIDQNDQDVADWLKGQQGVTGNQLAQASSMMSPITTIIGYITGGILVLVVIGVGLITALDLLYIALPPIRGFLCNDNNGKRRQFISDEAIACAGISSSQGTGQSYNNSNNANLNSNNNSNNANWNSNNNSNNEKPKVRSVIGTYFRKRLFFILLLTICIIVLTSSAIMKCGVNMAEWVLKIISMFTNNLSAV